MKDRDEIEADIMQKMKNLRKNIGQNTDQTPDDGSDTVPYDKKAARSVIEKFIRDHPDKERFMADLKKKMED